MGELHDSVCAVYRGHKCNCAFSVLQKKKKNPRLDMVDRECMLRNAHRMADAMWVRSRGICSFVSQVCGVGSNSARQICEELGWDPDRNADAMLPERRKG